MYAMFRTHVFNKSCTLIKGCCHNNVQCICVVNNQIPYDFKETRRLLSISNPGIVTIFSSNSLKLNYYNNGNNLNLMRNFSLSSVCNDSANKPSSKVEVTVQELKKKQETETAMTEQLPKVVEKSLARKIRDEIVHYYHGFRLLFIDIKISTVLVFRVLTGHTLTRREYRLLIRTVGDMFRLVPFSVFIIVPFMEILLPFFIRFFPGMLPSTFQTASDKEDKLKQSLKVKLDMAKFLQETLDDMAVQHKDHKSVRAKEFSEWFHKVRTSGELVSTEEIMKFSKLFEDEITLDSLTRNQLIALCRVLEIQTLGTNNFLRFQLRLKLRSLAADDRMIEKEGVDALTLGELQQACRARGMRAYGVSEDRLKTQLKQWLDLSLHEKVPPSLLLLSRALMLPETIPTSDKLKATISVLPETIITQTKAAIGEKEGKIDNRVKIEAIREEEKKVKEERREQKEEKKKLELLAKEKEKLIDKAPIISASSTPILEDTATKISVEKLEKIEKKDETIEAKDFEIIEQAIDQIKSQKQEGLKIEKDELNEIKEQLADYKEDVEDLQKAVATQSKPEIKESKAAKRLYKSVNKMINKLDTVLTELEKKEEQLKEKFQSGENVDDGIQQELLKIDDILSAIKHIKGEHDDAKTEKIMKVLQKIDDDSDGSIKVEDVLKVIEIIGKENVNLTDKQVDELIDLLNKEQVLETETKIEKALQKDKELREEEIKKEHADSEKKMETVATGVKNDNQSTKSTTETKNERLETQSKIIPPPVDSIDQSKLKTKDNSKML